MVLLVSPVFTVFAETSTIEVNQTEATVEISRPTTNYSSFKVIVEKDDVRYIYDLVSETESFPLQMGSGQYRIYVLGSKDGKRFRLLSRDTITVELDEHAVFLSSSQTVYWTDDSDVTALAQAITKEAKTDREKLQAIHNYVVNNIAYDYDKIENLPKGYIPSAEATLEDGKGICYDFAAITAAMLRAVDVPTKLIKGYSAYTSAYHAWNEVLVDGEWVVVDTSTDSIYAENQVDYTLEKDLEDYDTSKVY